MPPHTGLPLEYVALLGVLLGGGIAILGNWLLAKKQARFQIHNTFFLHRLEVYLSLLKLLWPAGIRQHRPHWTEEDPVPAPYASNHELAEWSNKLIEFVMDNRILIDEKTVKDAQSLNEKVIEDLKRILDTSRERSMDIDLVTRSVGRESAETILTLCSQIHNSTWDYFKNTYGEEL